MKTPSNQKSDRNDLAKRFGAAQFIETLDTVDEDENDGDILSFDSFRKAFATLNAVEDELAEVDDYENPETSPVGASENNEDADDEKYPDYEIDEPEKQLDALRQESASETGANTFENLLTLSPRAVVEAVLFVGGKDNKPISADRIAAKMRNVSPEEIDAEVTALNTQYTERGAPYHIVSQSGGYRLVLRDGFEDVQNNFYAKERSVRLSQPAIDTLAVIAYRQPVTETEISRIRREPSLNVLNQLVRRGLVQIERKKTDGETKDKDKDNNKKSAVFYRTTNRFLSLFQLESLADLPMPDDF